MHSWAAEAAEAAFAGTVLLKKLFCIMITGAAHTTVHVDSCMVSRFEIPELGGFAVHDCEL